jgi:integrase
MEPDYLLQPDTFHHPLNTAEKSRDRLILFLLLLLGCSCLRLGEMIRAKAAVLRLEAAQHIGADNAKSRMSRTVLLPFPAIAQLRRQPSGSALDGGLPLQSRDLGPHQQQSGDIYAR